MSQPPRSSSLLQLLPLVAALACAVPPVPAPDFPIGLLAQATSGRVVQVSWEPSLRADRYTVRLAPVTAVSGGVLKKVKVTNARFDGLNPGVRYLVQVRAQNDAGDSVATETQVATFPAAPVAVKEEPIEGIGTRLTWEAVPGAAGYQVRRIAQGLETLVASTALLTAEDRSCALGEPVAYRIEALPGPTTETFTEVRTLCGRRREVCAIEPSGAGVLAYEGGGAGEQAPVGSFGPATGLTQPIQVSIDSLHDEVVVLDRKPVGDRVLRTLVTYARGVDAAPLRTLGPAQAPFTSELASFALDPAGARIYLTDGAQLYVFDRMASGSTPALGTLPLSGLVNSSQPFGRLLAVDSVHDELHAFGYADTTDFVIPLAAVRALSTPVSPVRTARLETPDLAGTPTRLWIHGPSQELALAQTNGVTLFDRLSLQVTNTIAFSRQDPGGVAIDATNGELWLQEQGTVRAVPVQGGDELRRLAGPLTGLSGSSTPLGLEVDSARGELLASGDDGLVVFPRTAAGNVAPARRQGSARGPVAPRALAFDGARGERFLLSRGLISVFAAEVGPGDAALRTLTLGGDLRGLAFDSTHDELWVLSTSPDGDLLRSFARDATGAEDARATLGVSASSSDPQALLLWDDELFVAGRGGVRVYDRTGAFVRLLSGLATAPGPLEADRSRGTLLVADRFSGALWTYARTASGVTAPLGVFSFPGKVIGLARDERTDEVFVLDDRGVAQAFDLQGGKAVRLRGLAGVGTRLGGTVGLGVCR